MDPLSLAVSTITIAHIASHVISTTIACGKSVQGLPDEVQSLVSEISLLSGVLQKLSSVLQYAADGEGMIPSSLGDATLKPALDECKAQLENLGGYLEKGQSKKARLKNLGRRLKWPMKEQETREWIARMERFKGSFSLALQTEDLVIQNKIRGDVAEIKVVQEETRIEKKVAKKSQRYRDALKWLSAADPKENHFFARKFQQKGTGRWFTESAEFLQWKAANSSFLWLYGTAGCGKTILSSLIIDHLMNEGTDPTIYFYCDFKDANKTRIPSIYASLMSQILQDNWHEELPADFETFYDKNQHSLPCESQLRSELIKLAGMIGRTRVVVDALDECMPEVRGDLLKTLLEIQNKGNINILVTSREEVDIRLAVENVDVQVLCLKILAASTSEDISLFVRGEIERTDSKLSRLRDSTKDEIASTIISGANGMFRWAKCSLDQIARLRNDRAIKQALKTLPPGLDETYERILESISDTDKELALRVLNWLVCAVRPLLIPEVVEAIALEFGASSLDPDSLLNDPDDLLDVCGSLLTVDQDTNTVVLAHFSVKEFLMSGRLRDGRHSRYFVDVMRANFKLARLCVTYLCFEDLSSGQCNTREEYANRCAQHVLFPYATKYWAQHAREHISIRDHKFMSAIECFFLDPKRNGNFLAWIQAYDHTDKYPPKAPVGDERLPIAARFGLYSTAQLLLSKGFDPNASSRRYACNVLTAACKSGNPMVLELLLDHGANINAIGGAYGTALIASIACGNRQSNGFATLRCLIKRGAEINLITPDNNFATREAVRAQNSTEALQILIDAGADLGLRDQSGQTMTEVASGWGLADYFRVLWENGGGNFIPSGLPWKFTPGIDGYSLALAAGFNHFEIGQQILEKDGEKIFSDSSFEELVYYVFGYCAGKGFYKFLEYMLVYSGTENRLYVTALQVAVVQGKDKTVAMLLNAWKKEQQLPGNPLLLAAAAGHKKIVGQLLEAGEDPAATDCHGWSAALAASVGHQHEISDMFESVGKPSKNAEPKPLNPSSWLIDTSLLGAFEKKPPIYEVSGGTASLSAQNQQRYTLYSDHPLVPRDSGWCYYELTILETGELSDLCVQFGLTSALALHDFEDSSLLAHTCLGDCTLGYQNSGIIAGKTECSHPPSFSSGSVVGCAVSVDREEAYFTCDGKIINVLCKGVKGILYGAVYMSPGTKIRANFGKQPFSFDVAKLEKTVPGQAEWVVDYCHDRADGEWHDKIGKNPVKRFIG